MHTVAALIAADRDERADHRNRGDKDRQHEEGKHLKRGHDRRPFSKTLAVQCSMNAHKSQTIPDAMTMGSDGMAGPIPYIEAATGAKTPIVRNEVEARSNALAVSFRRSLRARGSISSHPAARIR